MARRASPVRIGPLAIALLAAAGCARSAPPAADGPPPGVVQRGVIEPRRLAFHPRDPDRLLVVERRGDVAIWAIPPGTTPYTAWSVAAHAVDAQFLPDGAAVATGGADGRVRVWDADGRERWRAAVPHRGTIRALAVATDRIASAGEDGVIRLWTLDGDAAGSLEGHAGMILAVAFSPRGRWLASEGADTHVRLWRRDDAGRYAAAGVLRGVNAKFQRMLPSLVRWDVQWGWDRSVAFAPDRELLGATGFDGAAQLWDLEGTAYGPPLRPVDRHHLRSIAFSPTADLVATGALSGVVYLWQVDGTPQGTPLRGHTQSVSAVDFNHTGTRLASAGIDGAVLLWDPASGERVGGLPRER